MSVINLPTRVVYSSRYNIIIHPSIVHCVHEYWYVHVYYSSSTVHVYTRVLYGHRYQNASSQPIAIQYLYCILLFNISRNTIHSIGDAYQCLMFIDIESYDTGIYNTGMAHMAIIAILPCSTRVHPGIVNIDTSTRVLLAVEYRYCNRYQ